MAKSTYISRNLTGEQMDFLQVLNEEEVIYFSLEDIESRLGQPPPNVNELVENLRQKGFLDRVERGKYVLPQFRDPYVLATFIAQDGAVGYWSALHLHGLTERFPHKLFIKTPKRKRDALLFGTTVHFVTVQARKMLGISRNGYGDTSYAISDVEMTLLDCFDLPRYAGAWPDLLRAFDQAEMDAQKLIEYAAVYNNASVIRRLGYLAELLNKEGLKGFIGFARQYVGEKYSLFEPGGEERGAFYNRWKLRMNMDESDVLGVVNDPY